MKKALKICAVVLIAAFVIMQIFQPDRTNPPVDTSQSLMTSGSVPPHVALLLERSCKDCHTNQTNYPWYSNISPFSWFLDGHIRNGRQELNFSTWASYPNQTKIHKLDELCEMVSSGEMPLPSYLWIHRDAVLTDADRSLLCDWANAESARLGQRQ